MANEGFEFEITKRQKKKAKKRRIKNERKWLGLKWVYRISFVISVLSFISVFNFVDHSDEIQLLVFSFIFALSLVIGVIAKALIANMASHWIEDRLNEKIWIDNGYLYHFIQKAFSGGLNYRHADERATVYEIEIASITNGRYDPASGRLEFNAVGRGVEYADYNKGIIEEQWELSPPFTGIFYDYTNPSLYKYLVEVGVQFQSCTIDFKIFDARI